MSRYDRVPEFPEVVRARWEAEQQALIRAMELQEDEPPLPRYPRDPQLAKVDKVVRVEEFGEDEARRVHRRSLIVRRFERETARQMSERRTELLQQVERVSEEVAILRSLLEAAIDRRDEVVREAYRHGLKRPVIAEVSGVSTAQINNITSGRFPAKRHREPEEPPKLPVRNPVPIEQLDDLARVFALEDAAREYLARQHAAYEQDVRERAAHEQAVREHVAREQASLERSAWKRDPLEGLTEPGARQPATAEHTATRQTATEHTATKQATTEETATDPTTDDPEEAAPEQPAAEEPATRRRAARKKAARRRSPMVDEGDVAGSVS